jgi:recombination DNA repair RAD52 pathway protein
MSEIEKTILNVLENDTIEQKYTWDNILEMFDGTSHFDIEQLKYVYHHLNNHEEKAKYYLEICLSKSQKLIEQSKKMKITTVDDKISVEI